MGELAPVAWTLERVSPTPHRPPQLPPSGRTGPSSVGTGDLAPTFVDRGRIAPVPFAVFATGVLASFRTGFRDLALTLTWVGAVPVKARTISYHPSQHLRF